MSKNKDTVKKSMVVYRNWYEALNELKDDPELYMKIANAILSYGLDGEIQNLNGAEKAIFRIMKDQMDVDKAKWEEISKKRSEAGAKGNQKRWNKADEIANATDLSQNVASIAVNDNVNVNEYIYKYIYNTALDLDVKKCMVRYIDHRSQKGNPVTSESIKQIISDLTKMSIIPEEQVQIIEQTIHKGWTGLFPLEKKSKKNAHGFTGRKLDFEKLESNLLGGTG